MSEQERPLREEYEEAQSMLACPYYLREETCIYGCWSEPACITDAPLDGWQSVVDAYLDDAA